MARPVGSKNKPKTLSDGEPLPEITAHGGEAKPFTGVARSMECVKWNGFNNFYNVTLQIEGGVVVGKTYSEPFALFEAISRMDLDMHVASLNLNTGYTPGLAWRK